ncbi:hypothetical protein [Myxosarcina sp. GI1(2024)]
MNDSRQNSLNKFIVYACPVGKLNSQLETYFQQSRELYGHNKAHNYMPHCTLTGFFEDRLSSISVYLQALDLAYQKAQDNYLSLEIDINKLIFSENWHGLEIQADGLKQLIADFAGLANSPTRQEEIRLKDWLHLSLAYDFNPKNAAKLHNLAIATIDIKASVNWELRFYQKSPDWSWRCLQSWCLMSNE